jgi:hypothetical protein
LHTNFIKIYLFLPASCAKNEDALNDKNDEGKMNPPHISTPLGDL